MAYPPSELTYTNINPTESFDLDKFNTRFSDLKTYAESLKEGIDNRVVKVDNYGLSKNDFTDSYKTTLDNLYKSSNTNKNGHKHSISEITDLSTSLDNKVNKETGKGLSTNDFTDNGRVSLLSSLISSLSKVKYKDFTINSTGDFSFSYNISHLNTIILGYYTISATASGSGGGLDMNNVSVQLTPRLFTVDNSWNYGGRQCIKISGSIPNMGSSISCTIRVLWVEF